MRETRVCLKALVQGVSASVLLGRIICRNVFHEEGVLVCGKACTNTRSNMASQQHIDYANTSTNFFAGSDMFAVQNICICST